MADNELIPIAAALKRIGISARADQHDECCQLYSSTRGIQNGRLFNRKNFDRIAFTTRRRSYDLSVMEIRAILAGLKDGEEPTLPAGIKRRLEQRTEAQIAVS